MITNPRIIVTPNVNEDNDGINLPPLAGQRSNLSAITITVDAWQHLKAGRLSCLLWATNLVSSALPTYKLWLLVCQGGWQPDTKVRRYFGLWRSFEKSGVSLPEGRRSPEVIRIMDDQLQFFGWISVDPQELSSADLVMRDTCACLLVATGGEPPDLDSYLEAGWATTSPMTMDFWAKMSQVATDRGGLLIRPFGSFDDREAAVNVIGDSAVVARLASAIQPQP